MYGGLQEIMPDNVRCAFSREEETPDRTLLAAAAEETASMALIWISVDSTAVTSDT